MRRSPAILAAAVVLPAVVALGLVRHDAPTPSTSTVAEPRLPSTPAPAFAVPTPRLLRDPATLARWATIEESTDVRRAPSPTAAVVTRIATATPEGTANLVLILGRARSSRDGLWVRVRLPILPNNSTGWVPRSALGAYHAVTTRLVVDLEQLAATLYRGGEPIFSAPVGVGRPQWPTPRGEFYIRDKLTRFRSPFYGPVAFGTSARSAVLTDWPAGGFVGIHGTNLPELLPGRVSHGCIRMRNTDILELARLMPVGTPLTIR